MNRNYFEGRYGLDRYSKFLIIISLPFLLSRGSFLLGAIIVGYAAWRVFSKNTEGRRKEEWAFEDFLRRTMYWIRGLRQRGIIRGLKESFQNFTRGITEKHRYVVVACPRCEQKLRLPRRKGNIVVTCKKCSHEFKLKT